MMKVLRALSNEAAFGILGGLGAIKIGGHFVYTTGQHSTHYFDKHALYANTIHTSNFCGELAKYFRDDGVEVVLGPALGGIVIAQWIAYHLENYNAQDVLAVFAEKFRPMNVEDLERKLKDWIKVPEDLRIPRELERHVAGKRVLIVDNIITTGNTIRKVIERTRSIGGEVIGVGTIMTNGHATENDLSVPKLVPLLNFPAPIWEEEECARNGPCSQGIPINTGVGKGAEFLMRRDV
ncbi:MAG TPA: phosphoribosyltransferase family protein [Candidatus Paceibacterota bacterium]